MPARPRSTRRPPPSRDSSAAHHPQREPVRNPMPTTTQHDHTVPAEATHEVDLAISGMTCASCSARVEKKLNRLDGVEASVNLATEKAKVRFAGPVTVE